MYHFMQQGCKDAFNRTVKRPGCDIDFMAGFSLCTPDRRHSIMRIASGRRNHRNHGRGKNTVKKSFVQHTEGLFKLSSKARHFRDFFHIKVLPLIIQVVLICGSGFGIIPIPAPFGCRVSSSLQCRFGRGLLQGAFLTQWKSGGWHSVWYRACTYRRGHA